jgi:hypothetical protein
MVNHGVVALGLASATLVASIITIATPVLSYFGESGANAGGYYSGLTVTSFVVALGVVGAAAYAHVKKHSQSWLAAAALTFLVFVFELAAFAKFASDFSQFKSYLMAAGVYADNLSYSASFAFAIITWLLSMPTMAFCFLASKAPAQAPAQAQAPAMAQAEEIKADTVPQGVTSV